MKSITTSLMIRLVLVLSCCIVGPALCCRISEFMCKSTDKCVRLDEYCDGKYDCPDKSDEPPSCTACNRTYYGEVGYSYRLNVKKQSKERPFLCHLSFTASGQEHGDFVELIFEEFRVGTLYAGQCVGGEMQILELGRPYVGGSWCGAGPADGGAPAVYYSEAGTVTVTLRVPYAGGLQYAALPFAFALRFKFLDNRHAAVRLGTAAAPKERGELVPGTRCSRNFYECYRKRCSVQSPNYPGLYPRNVTCHYTVRQTVVPKCKHAMVSVGRAAVGLPHRPPSARSRRGGDNGTGSAAAIRVNDMCSDGAEDRLVFYDGPSERDPVLLTFCGGPALPRVVASGPVMLVAFTSREHDSPAAAFPAAPSPASRLLRSFELDAYIAFVDSDSLDYARGAACEFVINASTAASRSPRRGVLVGPQHSVPANSTCTYRFQGQPDDRVWMYFETYGHRSAGDYFTFKPCSTRLRIWDGAGTLLGDHCDAPRLCEHHRARPDAASNNGTRPKRPCTPDESYLSKSPSVILQVHSALGTVLQPFAFTMHYEFVDSGAYDRENGGGACAIRYSRVRESMDVTEPRNVFLYGRGGAKNLDCLYRLEAEPGYRMQIVVRNASFGSSPRECGAAPVAKTAAGKFTCGAAADRSPRLIVREVFWRGVEIERGCFCQNFTEAALGAQQLTFDPSSDTVEIQFRVSDMDATEDFANTYFNVHVRVLRSPPCPRKQWARGSGGEIELAYPFEARDDLYCHDKPWLLEARPDHSVFVQTWGRFLPLNASSLSLSLSSSSSFTMATEPCKTRNRILLYALRPVRLIRNVCPADARDNRHSVYVFSDEWTDFVPAADRRPHNPSFVVEFLALEPGTMAFKWLEVSKPKPHHPRPEHSGDNRSDDDPPQRRHHRFGCAYGCPELNACISATLWCDGHRNCPSGVDEADLNCQAKWPSFKALRSYGLPAVGVCLAGAVLALLAWIFCGGGRRGPDRDYRHHDDEHDDEHAAEPATGTDNTRSCSSIAS